jgi:chromosome partitioning protein
VLAIQSVSTIIAIANQKGGVGKTTSAISIASELALNNFKTLLVDFDPQGNATSGLGVSLRDAGEDLFDMFLGKTSLSKIIRSSMIAGLDVAPSSADLVGIEIELGKTAGRELILKSELELLRPSYDFILIDCPPASGLLSLNALGAAEQVLIPLQAEYYALEGLSALMKTVDFVRQTFNPDLNILGVFLTMFDARTNLSIQVEQEAKQFFGALLMETRIPRNIKLSEAPSHSKPICLYDPLSAGAKAYKALAGEVIDRTQGKPGEQQSAKVANE